MAVRQPTVRSRVEYKKPSRINSVSIGLVLFLGLIGYLGYCFYPNFILAGHVKEALRSELLTLYRINLQPAAGRKRALMEFNNKMKKVVVEAGVQDPNYKVVIEADPKTVAMEAHFTSTITFAGINKTATFNHSPRVETSAERVDW